MMICLFGGLYKQEACATLKNHPCIYKNPQIPPSHKPSWVFPNMVVLTYVIFKVLSHAHMCCPQSHDAKTPSATMYAMCNTLTSSFQNHTDLTQHSLNCVAARIVLSWHIAVYWQSSPYVSETQSKHCWLGYHALWINLECWLMYSVVWLIVRGETEDIFSVLVGQSKSTILSYSIQSHCSIYPHFIC